MTDTTPPPVADWATDFDHTHPDYAANAPAIWDELRETCPVARSERFGGVWLPVRHDDVRAIADDTDTYSSRGPVVTPYKPDIPAPIGYAPPISSDPPFHAIARRLLLPPFAPKAVKALEPFTRTYCNQLIDQLLADGPEIDAAIGYAQHIPVKIIAHMLGVPEEDGDLFRTFIHRIMESPGVHEDLAYEDTLEHYLDSQITLHRANPRNPEEGGDLIDYLIQADIEGMPLSDEHVRGSVALLLIAGIDTTWSAIGASLWHLAQHPEDRQRLVDQPEIRPFAVEEFLRAYAPVTMARIATTDHELRGCPVKEGDWLLLPFPAANRDPEMFEDADRVIIDRKANRHGAFGLGIHRCLGSNLARMELTVALDTWLDRVGPCELIDPTSVRWSTGQIRGPRELPMRLL